MPRAWELSAALAEGEAECSPGVRAAILWEGQHGFV